MIACPKCRSYMFSGKKRGVQIDCCSSCQGIWLDSGELATITQTAKDFPVSTDSSAVKTDYPCPRCGNSLDAQPYRPGEPLLVDQCAKCQGVYLDKGELERIQNLAQQIDEIFTPARKEKMVSKARRNEALSAVYKTTAPVAKDSISERGGFLLEVFGLLTSTLIVTAIAAYYGVTTGLGAKYFLPAVIAEVVVFFITMCVRRVPGVNLVALFTYTGVSGFTLSVVLQQYLKSANPDVVWQAAGTTAAIFGLLSGYVLVTKKDFSWLAGVLFILLIGLILSGICLLFVGSEYQHFLWSIGSAVLFSGFIMFDTSRIQLKYNSDEVVSAVIDLYLDVINLFLDLLRIMGYLRKN